MRGVREKVRDSGVNTKVREGWDGGATGAGARTDLQHIERTTVEQICILQPTLEKVGIA